MRRLLVFGTGAAVIGIVLLIVAFFESYLIVSSLQKELGSGATDTNLLLEDATLEAVFLGVMAALGYGLISKGLDGIRKQELLELQVPAEEVFGSQSYQARQEVSRPAIRSSGVKSSSQATRRDFARKDSATTKQDVRRAPQEVSEIAVGAQTQSASTGRPQKSWWESAPSKDEPVVPSDVKVSAPAQQLGQHDTVQMTAPAAIAPPIVSDNAHYNPGAVKTADSKSEEVVWEGGAAPSLEGVEVVPEPSMPGMDSNTNASSPTSQPVDPNAQASQVEPGMIIKRKRGRPKGSKKQVKETKDESV